MADTELPPPHDAAIDEEASQDAIRTPSGTVPLGFGTLNGGVRAQLTSEQMAEGGRRSAGVPRGTWSREDTPRKKAAFLDAIRKGLSVGTAAKAAGVRRRTPYTWRENDPEFAEAWAEAREDGLDLIEDQVRKHVGDDWRAGVRILESMRPERWRRAVDANVTANVSATIEDGPRRGARQDSIAARLGEIAAKLGSSVSAGAGGSGAECEGAEEFPILRDVDRPAGSAGPG